MTDDMQGLIKQLRKRLADASEQPWVYRPGEYDDWGWIRGTERDSDIGRYRPIVANAKDSTVREESFAQHRRDGTDPYGANALLIVEAVNALPMLLDALTRSTDVEPRPDTFNEAPVSWNEERAREVLAQCCPGMGWSEGEKQTIAIAMMVFARSAYADGQRDGLPKGMVLVPREPTQDMLNASNRAGNRARTSHSVWTAMIEQHEATAIRAAGEQSHGE